MYMDHNLDFIARKTFSQEKNMETSSCVLMPSSFRFSLLIHLLLTCCFFSCVQPLCHSHERLALMQFKDGFTINKDASGEYSSSYPKVASWTMERNNSDCCSWDGVKCDDDTGHVIGLDLTSSWLYGAIDSNSSLFKLSQLQSLSLADNDFNYSQIPSGLGNLSRLVHLNLSFSNFKGEIPSEISQLSKLAYLDLSAANTNSTVPHFLANLSSLVTLRLGYYGFYGEFPNSIFQLPNLKNLDLEVSNLFGSLPEFQSGSPLERLLLWYTDFSGTVPSSIGNLDSLIELSLDQCRFSGLLPTSLGKLTKLAYLGIAENNFTGEVPSFLQNLTNLRELWLDGNQFSGQIPAWLANLTHLASLSLGSNKLHGLVPHSFSRFANIESLLLSDNELSGTLEIEMFLDLKYLSILHLSGNNISLLTETNNPNATVSKFEVLDLGSCNLSNFPNFLRYQEKLQGFYLSQNKIYGKIPKWVLNMSTESLLNVDLSRNLLTGFDQLRSPVFLPWVRLVDLDLSDNMLKGFMPIPLPSIVKYDISKNELSEEISPLLCNTSRLQSLDLSNNKLTGRLPKCLEKLSQFLSVLNLGNNSLHGIIPQIGWNGSKLIEIDFSHNLLEGTLPRSLAKCTRLEVLNLGNNKLSDVFPFWLGSLPELRILLLRQNRFHGVIRESVSDFEFPSLHVIDLSYNNFSGLLPSENLQKWNAMKAVEVKNSSYLKGHFNYYSGSLPFIDIYVYSMSITNKGVVLDYTKIQEAFAVIDFSSNRFEGEIPDCIGSLQGLLVLNLSNNSLTGSIPSSLGNTTSLESLDLSQNKLTGEIPQQLLKLTFLAFLNVSHNNLKGQIPRGNQFNTFENSSYIGNSELCGDPLPKKCKSFDQSPMTPASSFEEQDSESVLDSNWMIILFGYLGGLVVGIAIEHTVGAEYVWSRTAFLLRNLKEREYRRIYRARRTLRV